ncbi:DUF2189 domain-containing protein [Microvirga flavescens]|uniref:DUF2189 domain-containing protein n=1 Tax=Microvirga flavescens TaxID=2249811 RepID=UPI000DDB9D1A|nr:DUF2189 domain-containing protein [Microvirga flavescens]
MVKIHVVSNSSEVQDDLAALPVRRIGIEDLKDALREGFDDFWAMPSQVFFLIVLYPIIGLFLARFMFGYRLFPLLFPVVSGFALVGPFAALALYELSRRRERGLPTSLRYATDVFVSPAIGSILVLGLMLAGIFLVWVGVAETLYLSLFGKSTADSMLPFLREVLTTREGWLLILIGNAIGFAFSALAFCLSIVSFPLLLDRHVSIGTAIRTSFKVVATNPRTMLVWALIVAFGLFLGFLPAMVGLAVALPVLGHATWHLYRKVVV